MHNGNPHDKLEQALRSLPREALPARDLWPGIEHAIGVSADPARPPYRYHVRQLALAASVLLLLALSLYYGGRQPAPALTNPVVLEFLDTLRSEHRTSVQNLLARYQEQQPYYPDWTEQMQQLEQAEQVIYQALRDEPANLELVKILRQVQNQQLQLIDAVFDPRAGAI